jgi:hypothetical protein
MNVILVFILLISSIVSVSYNAISLAYTHTGEQTAAFMSENTEIYVTINLRPGISQGLTLKSIVDKWWNYEGSAGILDSVMDVISTETDNISIESDIVPWLGPEIAAGVRGLGSVDQPPEFVLMVGTTDMAASNSFIFDKFLPWGLQDTGIDLPTGPDDTYYDIDTLTIEIDETNTAYLAFVDDADDYLVFSMSSDLFYDCLDLFAIGGTSLADTPSFQAAQASLPKPVGLGDPPAQEERTAMVYFNSGSVWEQLTAQVEPNTPEALAVELATPYIPGFAALSASLIGDGIKLDFYTPTPAALDVSSLAPVPLNATDIIPGDADAVCSVKDISGVWEVAKDLAGDNWVNLGTLLDAGDYWPDSPASLLGILETDYGINLDEDLFGWMNGECTVAKLPSGTGPTGPDMLAFLQVSDPTLVEGKLEGIIDAINADMVRDAFPWQTVDPLELEQTPIGDVAATFVTNSAIEAAGASPGYLFVDNFLVIGSSRDALTAVVATRSHPELSLTQTAEFQWITDSSRLGTENNVMAYVNGSRLVDYFLSLMYGSERSDFQKYGEPFLDPLRSCGLSVSIGQDAIRGCLILHVGRTSGTLVEGQVRLQGRLEHDGVAVGGQQAATNVLGRFSLSSLSTVDNATVTASMPGYLSAQRTGVTIREGTRTSLGAVTLIAGDIGGDGAINSADLAAMGSAFNSSPPSTAAADINQDGIVDVYDLVWVGQNQGKSAPTTWLLDPSKGAISGLIYGSDGLRVANASVYASGIDVDGWVESYTNADGSYALEGLPEGNYRLRAYASGYFSEYYQDASWQTATPVAVTGSQETTGINLTLQLGGSISGHVYDSSGSNPLSGARIVLFDATTHNQIGQGYTTSDGSYRVAGLQTGSYDLRAGQIGYLLEFYQGKTTLADAIPVEVTVGQERSDINFTLELGGSISGHVYDSSGTNPLSGASITVYDSTTHNQVRSDYTASDGSYKTQGAGLPSGSYHVRASLYGYLDEYYDNVTTVASAAVVTLTAPNPYPDVNFTLDAVPVGSISGHVYDSSGTNPLPDAYVVAYDSSTHQWVRSGYTATDGSYKIKGLPNGSYHVAAHDRDDEYLSEYYQDAATVDTAQSVSLTVGEDRQDVNFTMDPAGSISGHVYRSDGRPLSDASVAVYVSLGSSPVAWGYTNWFGHYEAVGLPAGDYYVKADSYGYAEEYYQDAVSVTLGEETSGIDFTVDVGGYISGHVYDSQGNPVPSSSITVYDSASHNQIGSGYTRSDGSYIAVGLPTASYHVRASRDWYSPVYIEEYYYETATLDTAALVSVTVGQVTPNIDFTLDRLGSISGTVRDLQGNPLSGVNVAVCDATTHNWVRSGSTASDGSYKVEGLSTGSYHVMASRYLFLAEYYQEAATIDIAQSVSVTLNQDKPNINFTLAPSP